MCIGTCGHMIIVLWSWIKLILKVGVTICQDGCGHIYVQYVHVYLLRSFTPHITIHSTQQCLLSALFGGSCSLLFDGRGRPRTTSSKSPLTRYYQCCQYDVPDVHGNRSEQVQLQGTFNCWDKRVSGLWYTCGMFAKARYITLSLSLSLSLSLPSLSTIQER